eukprot:3154155-Rhodomonas_salina.1
MCIRDSPPLLPPLLPSSPRRRYPLPQRAPRIDRLPRNKRDQTQSQYTLYQHSVFSLLISRCPASVPHTTFGTDAFPVLVCGYAIPLSSTSTIPHTQVQLYTPSVPHMA